MRSARRSASGSRRSGKSLSAPTAHARGGRRPERRRRLSTASGGRARCSSGRGLPATASGRAIKPGAGSVLSVAFNHDGTLLATASYRGRVDLWNAATHTHHGSPMKATDDGFPSVVFDPSGRLVAAARDRAGAGLARGRSAAGVRAALRPHRTRHGDRFRLERPVPGHHERFRRDQALGPGDRSRLRRRAGREPEPGIGDPVHRPAVSGHPERVQPGRQGACRRRRPTRARCCGTSTRRCGNSARARSSAGT